MNHLALAGLEARRHLTAPPLWLGLAGSALVAVTTSTPDGQGGSYEMMPLHFLPLAAGAFVAGAASGGRDHHPRRGPLAEAAPVGPDGRAVARLVAMAPLVLVAALLALGVAIGTRLEGGYWIGDEPGRIDDALHTLPELVQPVMVCAVAAAVGVALGRSVRRSGPFVVLGVALLFVLGGLSWAWQWTPARYVALVQNHPIDQPVAPPAADPTALPDEWLLGAPGEYDPEWRRMLVVPEMAAWHDVYLVGLLLVAAGLAARAGLGRALLVTGVVLVVVGVAAQVGVAPAESLAAVAP